MFAAGKTCIRCKSTGSGTTAFLEIAAGRDMCSDCAIYSNEGYMVETGISVKCNICLKNTTPGEEYLENPDGEFVCEGCMTQLSACLEMLFNDDTFNPPTEENVYIPQVPSCAVCDLRTQPGGQDKPLLVCGACKVVYYCCVEHQKEHWPEHKKPCKALRKNADSQPPSKSKSSKDEPSKPTKA